MSRYCIVVTGLPASGKTTMGRIVADHLGIPFIDKDDFLETLFEQRGIGNNQWRQLMSREADRHFIAAAQAETRAVLIAHWRPPGLKAQFGTPTDWLSDHFEKVIELHCRCPVEIAAQRFAQRDRHPGHVDKARSLDQISEWLCDYNQYLPLRLQCWTEIDTSTQRSNQILLDELKQMLSCLSISSESKYT